MQIMKEELSDKIKNECQKLTDFYEVNLKKKQL